MPKEVKSVEELLSLVDGCKEVRVKDNGDEIKIKVRRVRYLYTYKTNDREHAIEVLKKIKEKGVPIVFIDEKTDLKDKI